MQTNSSNTSMETFDSPILLHELPRLVAPIVQYVHEHRPSRVIALDRGARLGAFALYVGYKLAFKQPFPTETGRIEFMKLSKNENYSSGQLAAMAAQLRQGPNASGGGLLVMDDWIDSGTTMDTFLATAALAGYKPEDITIATLCGRQYEGARHIVGDPTRTTINSVWNAYEETTGVRINGGDLVSLAADPNDDSVEARQKIYAHSVAYYDNGDK